MAKIYPGLSVIRTTQIEVERHRSCPSGIPRARSCNENSSYMSLAEGSFIDMAQDHTPPHIRILGWNKSILRVQLFPLQQSEPTYLDVFILIFQIRKGFMSSDHAERRRNGSRCNHRKPGILMLKDIFQMHQRFWKNSESKGWHDCSKVRIASCVSGGF